MTSFIPISPDSVVGTASVGEARDLRQWSVAGQTRSFLPDFRAGIPHGRPAFFLGGA